MDCGVSDKVHYHAVYQSFVAGHNAVQRNIVAESHISREMGGFDVVVDAENEIVHIDFRQWNVA